ncbi:MAG: DNA repair protein RadC [Bacteroidales bacterium]
MNKKLKITDWAPEDRPREKLLSKGIQSLTDAELLAIIIGSGNTEETAVELCKRILNDVSNNLNELGKFTITGLQEYKGIGEAKAISIVAALELGKRRKISEILDKKQISSSKDAFELFVSIIGDLPYEEFWIIYLNRSNKITGKEKISQGGISGTVIDNRIILKNALERLASGIIICHNHPSGNRQPSKQDLEITKKLSEAAKLFDINLLDHIIIANHDYLSFADEGLL